MARKVAKKKVVGKKVTKRRVKRPKAKTALQLLTSVAKRGAISPTNKQAAAEYRKALAVLLRAEKKNEGAQERVSRAKESLAMAKSEKESCL